MPATKTEKQIVGYLAVDQYGTKYNLIDPTKNPGKQLKELLCIRKKLEPMYVDDKDGRTKHVGYGLGDMWFNIYEVYEWEGPETGK